MNITLSPTIQAKIQEQIDHGDYTSPDEVVGEALRLLEARNAEIQHLKELIEVGEHARQDGKTRIWSPELRQELNRDADAAIARGDRVNPNATR